MATTSTTDETATDGDSDEPQPAYTPKDRLVRSWPAAYRSRADLLIIGLVTAISWFAVGLSGLLAGGVLVVAWTVLPAVGVYAIGNVAVAALLADEAPLYLGLATAVLAGLLVTAHVSDSQVRGGATVLAFGVTLAALALATYTVTGTLWLTGLLVAGVSGIAFVTMSMYALTRIGKASDE